MASPYVSKLSGKADVSASDSDDCNENGWQVEEEGFQLIAKKNTTSKVWKYFGFVTDEDGTHSDNSTPRCRLCHKGVSEKWSNTSNLINHVKLHHGSEYREIKRAQPVTAKSASRKTNSSSGSQQTLEECVKKTSTNSKDHRRLAQAVTNYIVKDVVPAYTVDKDLETWSVH